MDLKDIKELIGLMRKNDLSEFQLEQEGFKITLKRGVEFQPATASQAAPIAVSHTWPQPQPSNGGGTTGGAATATPEPPKEKLREITSPMVGTFYASPSPDASSFASVGQEITEDTTVCIIEAMKVMNEIKAECRGTIAEIVAENGKPVQFGQVLFRVR